MNDAKLRQLLSEMSLEEKIGQMIQLTGVYYDDSAVLTGAVGEDRPPEWVVRCAGSVLGVIGEEKIRDIQKTYMERHPHHIPLLFMADVIHGCRTIAPIPLGQACSFHPDLVHEAAGYAAAEASSEGIKATFSPMIDVSRDPRWGRIMESFGEDPYLNGVMGTAMVEGYQGYNRSDETRIGACLKHYAGYGAVSGGREYNDVDMSRRTFEEQYLKPFRMAVQAEPAMVMTAFNAVDRRPVSGNRELLQDILRDGMGFDGTVISDWGSIGQLEEQRVAADQAEAAGAAVRAGVDIDMMSPAYMFHLKELVESGKVPEELIDQGAWRVLEMKNRLGLFEDPCPGLGKSSALSPGARDAALRLACESCVLLKNDGILPLDPEKKVFWAGPYVDSQELLSRWAIFGRHADVDTIGTVLAEKKAPVRLIRGCEILTEEESRMWQADNCKIQGDPELPGESPASVQELYGDLDEIGANDTVVLVLGEHEAQSGEAASRAFLDLPAGQRELFARVAERTGHIITVVLSGRPLDLREIAAGSEALLLAWRPGTMGAEAITRLIYGEETPSGKLSVSIPWCVGQIPVSYWNMTTGHCMSEADPDNRFVSRYMDIPNEALYPFGYGLSYTSFQISPPELQEQDDHISITCKVANTGGVEGAEVVQCYVETLCAPVVRPAKELIRFRKVFLKPGEEQVVRFEVDRKELYFLDENMEETGAGIPMRIMVGNSSRDEAGSVCFRL